MPLKTLLVMRHAKSSWKKSGLTDHERPLNKRGNRDAPKMGRLLRELDMAPDLIVSSTAVRARETAELVAAYCGYEEPIDSRDELYLASADDYLSVMQSVPESAERVLVVSHNPGCEELVTALTKREENMTTSAIAYLRVQVSEWNSVNEETSASLLCVWRPKELEYSEGE